MHDCPGKFVIALERLWTYEKTILAEHGHSRCGQSWLILDHHSAELQRGAATGFVGFANGVKLRSVEDPSGLTDDGGFRRCEALVGGILRSPEQAFSRSTFSNHIGAYQPARATPRKSNAAAVVAGNTQQPSLSIRTHSFDTSGTSVSGSLLLQSCRRTESPDTGMQSLLSNSKSTRPRSGQNFMPTTIQSRELPSRTKEPIRMGTSMSDSRTPTTHPPSVLNAVSTKPTLVKWYPQMN